MKTLVCLFILCFYFAVNGQTSTTTALPTYFVQAQVNELTNQEIRDYEQVLRSNPYVAQARIDVTNGQVLVVTSGLSSLTESDFRSWLNLNDEKLSCVFVGIYGVDVFKAYPFINCNN